MSYRFYISFIWAMYGCALAFFGSNMSSLWQRDASNIGYFFFLVCVAVVMHLMLWYWRSHCRGWQYSGHDHRCNPEWNDGGEVPCFWEKFDVKWHAALAFIFFLATFVLGRFFIYSGPGIVLFQTEKEGRQAWEEKRLEKGQYASYHSSVPTTFFAESIRNGDMRSTHFLNYKVTLSVDFTSTCTTSLLKDGKPIAFVPREDTVRIGKVMLDNVEAELKIVEADFRKATGLVNLNDIGVQSVVGFMEIVTKRLGKQLRENSSRVRYVRGELYTGSLYSAGLVPEARTAEGMDQSRRTTSTSD